MRVELRDVCTIARIATSTPETFGGKASERVEWARVQGGGVIRGVIGDFSAAPPAAAASRHLVYHPRWL